MASILKNTTDGQFVFRDSVDFGSAPATANNSLIIAAQTPTFVQMDMTALADGNARASTKFDFGTSRPPLFRLDACMERAVAPADGVTYDFYLAESANAGTVGNPLGLTGTDEGITAITRGQIAQMRYVGTMLCIANVTNISTFIGNIRPTHRYGMLIAVNNTEGAMAATMDETHITLTPVDYADV